MEEGLALTENEITKVKEQQTVIEIDRSKYDDSIEFENEYIAPPGLNEEVIVKISRAKNEPEWMLQKRLLGYKIFKEKPIPNWGPDLSALDLDSIIYYVSPKLKQATRWEDVPEEIRKTAERIGIPEAERNSLGGAGFQFDCLTEDTLVFTTNGPIKIKDIKLGQKVFSYDEKLNKIVKGRVNAIANKGGLQVYELEVAGRKIKATSNHPFLTLVDNRKKDKQRARYKKEWVTLEKLKQGDVIFITTDLPDTGKSKSLPNKNPIFPEKTSEDLMWLLGLFLGDGWILKQKNKKSVKIAIPKSQEELQTEVEKILKKLFDYNLISKYESHLSINSIAIANFIESIGFRGNAKTKSVPDWVITLPKNEKLAFLGGYLDADGGVRKKEGDIVYTSVNKEILEKTKQICAYCGIQTSRITTFHTKYTYNNKTQEKEAYRLQLSGNLTSIKSRYTPKKERPINKRYNFKFRSILKTNLKAHTNNSIGIAKITLIKKLGVQLTYDIEVEKRGNFIAEGIIVHNSKMAYHKLQEELEQQGVVFENMDDALHKYPDLVKRYFMTSCISPALHKFAALHAAVWSGGTFIYVPENVKVRIPLQAYFRMNALKGGQFEHTLIIVEKNAEIHYIEGCSSPVYEKDSLHAGCVEVFVQEGARARYTSIENWSRNTYNLNTKRAIVQKNAIMEWVNGNMGCLTGDSKVFTNPKGPMEIQSLKTGDKIYVWDEKTNSIKSSKVNSKIPSGYKKVYKLEAGGREIEASTNHPFLALVRKKHKENHKKGFFHHEWKPLEQLKIGDIIGIAKKLPIKGLPYQLPRIKIGQEVDSKNQYSKFKMNTSHLYNPDISIPNKTNEDFMWLMGLILGDGYIDSKNNKINIATHEKEDYREELIKILKDLFNYKVTEKKDRYIIINSKILCRLLTEVGFGGTANTKKIPNWVFTLPESQILSFLAGYFDSDGHASSNALYFTSINKKLLEQIKLLGIQTGFGISRIFNHGKMREMEILGKKTLAKDAWRILFNGKKAKELPVKCKRKKEKIEKIKTRRNYVSSEGLNFKSKTNEEIGFVRINKIEEMGIKPTFDIEIEDNHNFVANGLIVHNSNITMLYPCSVLVGENAKTDYIGIAYAGKGQHQDTGCKVYHLAPNTSSNILSKGICKNGGIASYRGLVEIKKGAKNSTSHVCCDGLMLDNESKAITYPSMIVNENDVKVAHEAAVGKIGEEQLFYLMSRGLSESEATKMIVSGYIEPIIKELPLEYAVELNKLIELEIENSVS